jgi:hypothetical protein
MLDVIFYMKGVKIGYEGYGDKYIPKHQAELVHPAQDKMKAQKIKNPMFPLGYVQKIYEGQTRQ